MKITAEIIAVENNGDRLKVKVQGSAVNEAEWRSMGICEFSIPANKNAGKTFFVGRVIEIKIKP